ncbi:uncharacterized protein MONOS_3370 [Monocercomonoides exilis]|uniref:uncharacterized protein n=1 Tax=Monocercomonoides exilis TaxID=2049356 RepID=UPI00355A0154|nr:hypothetical protein MONOS_3370 [Monocercomonoides exilis]|eukprot:MONOS_3370.1-p1 / transcript=MONOS_3370.1 / gene=MONOS_3370 / organism=Monocercomonoides_exilis_PA203 / gene_product=unspecified product / transcript_product=unspecified product / location=Mono_scaffold00079:8135-9803(-) / protein_length=486 / sequence_SO=supercontig / SO=protein_coding / is_pseudo=false
MCIVRLLYAASEEELCNHLCKEEEKAEKIVCADAKVRCIKACEKEKSSECFSMCDTTEDICNKKAKKSLDHCAETCPINNAEHQKRHNYKQLINQKVKPSFTSSEPPPLELPRYATHESKVQTNHTVTKNSLPLKASNAKLSPKEECEEQLKRCFSHNEQSLHADITGLCGFSVSDSSVGDGEDDCRTRAVLRGRRGRLMCLLQMQQCSEEASEWEKMEELAESLRGGEGTGSKRTKEQVANEEELDTKREQLTCRGDCKKELEGCSLFCTAQMSEQCISSCVQSILLAAQPTIPKSAPGAASASASATQRKGERGRKVSKLPGEQAEKAPETILFATGKPPELVNMSDVTANMHPSLYNIIYKNAEAGYKPLSSSYASSSLSSLSLTNAGGFVAFKKSGSQQDSSSTSPSSSSSSSSPSSPSSYSSSSSPHQQSTLSSQAQVESTDTPPIVICTGFCFQRYDGCVGQCKLANDMCEKECEHWKL